MTEPTELAQLRHLYQNMVNGAVRDTASAKRIAEGLLAPAIEALERGTPPAGAGEPIGYLYCGGSYGDELADWEIVADQHQCDKLNEHHGSLGKEAKLPLYATPQPTQPQAGVVPLTLEAINAMAREYPAEDLCGWSYRMGVADAEALHGIKENTSEQT